MPLITYYAKCGWDTRTCPHELRVDVENKMSWNGNINIFFLFFSFTKNYLGKLFSPIEISRIPSKYLPCCYSLFFIIQYSMISAHWMVLIYSPQCLSTTLRIKFPTASLWKGKYPERRNFFFRTQIIFHTTEGNYLNKEISFSLCK